MLARCWCSVAHETSVCMHMAIKCLLPFHCLQYWTRPHNKQTLAEKAPYGYMNHSMMREETPEAIQQSCCTLPKQRPPHHWNTLVNWWVSRDLQHNNHKHEHGLVVKDQARENVCIQGWPLCHCISNCCKQELLKWLLQYQLSHVLLHFYMPVSLHN